jgi:GTP cyclohydrolase IA
LEETSTVATEQQTSIADSITNVLFNLGFDPGADGLKDTPMRVAKAYGDLLKGYDEDPGTYLARQFDMDDSPTATPYNGIVLLRDIELYSLCEHHMLPFVGKAHVAYIPSGNRVVGISKLARVVEVFARRLQVQERLTSQVADAIEKHLEPEGVAVVIEAEHFCIRMRGVGKQNSVMVTSELRGAFKTNPTAREELLHLMGNRSV